MIKPITEKERKAAIEKAAANARFVYDEPMPGMTELDNFNNPPQYNAAPLECIDAMEAMVVEADVDPHAAFCWQNSFKYLYGAGRTQPAGRI